jgi:hypothetical protein
LLFRTVFQGEARDLFSRLLGQPMSLRILWNFTEAPELEELPWECIHATEPLRTFLGLTQRYSLVRYLPTTAKPRFELAFTPPLRILAAFPAPMDAVPLNSEGEETILRHALAPALERRRVQLEVLRAGEVTAERLMEKVTSFRPHLFHFVGHGIAENGEAFLVIEGPERESRFLEASFLATILRDSQIKLAVLNACDTGKMPTADAITGLAGALILDAMPAVVGTTRKVSDDAALLFTREFYRCLLSGVPVEGAVVEARKALSIENWDWSLYALFAGQRDLSSMRLPRE